MTYIQDNYKVRLQEALGRAVKTGGPKRPKKWKRQLPQVIIENCLSLYATTVGSEFRSVK